MSASANAWRADVQLRVSRWLVGLTLAAHLAAAVAVALAYAPLWLKLLAWVLLPPYAWWCLRSVRLQRPDSVVAFREYADDWWIETASGQGVRVVLLPQVALWRYLLVLPFAELKPEGLGRRYSAVVLPDSLAQEGFRRLYVRLRFRKISAPGEPDDAALSAEPNPHNSPQNAQQVNE